MHSSKGLTKLFTDAGLFKYWFPVSEMPSGSGDWPTVTTMVAKNHRLLVFTSIASKEADEGIAYQWRYIVENECKFSKTIHTFLSKFFHLDSSVTDSLKFIGSG